MLSALMSFSVKMGKENDGILLNHKEEWNSDICHEMEEMEIIMLSETRKM